MEKFAISTQSYTTTYAATVNELLNLAQPATTSLVLTRLCMYYTESAFTYLYIDNTIIDYLYYVY